MVVDLQDKEVIVISLGGSVVLSKDIDHTFFKEFTQFITDLSRKYKIFLIIGGGKTARTYIHLGRAQRFSETDLDWLGIHATRLNALFLSMILTSEIQTVPETIEEALSRNDHLVIMGRRY